MQPTDSDKTNWYERYKATRIITLRVKCLDEPGVLARLLDAVGRQGAQVGDVRFIGTDSKYKIREIQLFFVDDRQKEQTLQVVRDVPDVDLVSTFDEVLEIHRNGTIETRARVRLDTLMDLRMVYTPGVASVCELIRDRPETAWSYTGLGNKIAIVTNGTAVLGLGDIGPLAALPVMEGKAAILSKFVGISADPFLIDSKDPKEIIDIVRKCSVGYGAIQLEDIAAPECFEIEQELDRILDKPVFHDDQHGTAVVCVGGLINALKRTGRKPSDCRAVLLGAGAAGSAIARFMLSYGVADVVVCDSIGALYRGRTERMNPWKTGLAEATNKENVKGKFEEVLRGRNLFVGVSKPNMVTKDMIRSMAPNPIVFALANPVSEISVSDAIEAGAAVAVDGRGMNNALAYPGLFRGALDVRAKSITPKMMLAASHALAATAPADFLLPDMLDMEVHRNVTEAVRAAWVDE
jgi:malate dehydrogenase (oxaloacetate-decarboxylating)